MTAYPFFFRREYQLHTCSPPDANCVFLRFPIFSFFCLQTILSSVLFHSPFIMFTVPWAPDCITTIFFSFLLILPSLLYSSATLFSLFFLSFLSFSKGNLFCNFIFPSLASPVNLNCASVIQKVTSTICLPFFPSVLFW